MADKAYTVTALGVLASTVDGTAVQVMRGGPVPSNASPEWLEHALALELIKEASAEGGLAAVYSGDGSVVVTGPVPEDLVGGEPEKPSSRSRSATKAE